MPTLREKAEFIADLVGKAEALNKALAAREQKKDLLDELVGSGLDGARDSLRKAMTFSVERRDGKGLVHSMDERGQRKSIETEDSSKYKLIDGEDNIAAIKAIERIVKIKLQMEEAKDSDGQPLFTAKDIIDELFTPMVREGLIPENLVVDGYSEVATMLREVVKSFKAMLKKQQEEKRLKDAKDLNDSRGGGTKMDMVKALGSRTNAFIEGQVSTVASKVGMTPEEFQRARTIASKSVATMKAIKGGVEAGKKLDGEIKGVKDDDLKLSEKLDQFKLDDLKVSPVVEKLANQLDTIESGPLKAVLAGVEQGLKKAAISFDELIAKNGPGVIEVLKKFAKLIESNGAAITQDVLGVLKEMASGIGDIAGTGVEKTTVTVDIQAAVRSGELRAGADDMAAGVELVLKAQLLPAGVAVSDLVSRAFVAAFDIDALVEMVKPALGRKPESPPDGGKVVALVSTALTVAVSSAHATLKPFGESLGKTFTGLAASDTLRIRAACREGVGDAAGLLTPLVAVVEKAAATVFDEAFLEALADDEVGDAINTTAKEQNAKQQEAELEEGMAEVDDFERMLVLIDEGGMALARQQSLDVLIGQLKKDEMDLQIVGKVGSLLSGAGGAITKMGTDSKNASVGKQIVDQGGKAAKTVATKVADSLVPALQAAELVMKIAVTVIKIAKRGELLRKFKADVDKAHKAGSYLLPSVENFYSAKVQQQTYASIELALQIVQLAGAICASVPEPITMAVGQALKASAEAAEAARDLTKTVHDETLLRKGWKLTLEAINNPANRRAGLDALRHNATLAVHSVAWAANNGNPIAVEIMRSCGVNAQTMADDGTDMDKLIDYLETLLSEDLRFKDSDKVKLDWVPEPLLLSYPAWFTLQSRARKANPPLSTAETPELNKELKKLDLQPSVKTLRANAANYDEQTLQGFLDQALKVSALLGQQKPQTADTHPHAEMVLVCQRLQGLADNMASELKVIVADRALALAP